MKRIFVPTDFSTCSDNAVIYAIELAKKYKSQIYAVHGFSATTEIISSDFVTPFQGVPGTLSAEQINDFIKERTKHIDSQLSKIKELGKRNGVEISTIKIESSLFEDLAKKADELMCDLVVMGSHGSSGIEEKLIGSNTQKFVRFSKTPVLVIKQAPKALNNIAFFSTFTQEGEKRIFNDFLKLFNNEFTKMHFVYVNTPLNFLDSATAQSRIENFLEETKPVHFDWHIYNDLSVEEGISNFSERNKIDLIVLATHGYTGIKRLFRHSYSESVINHIDTPVLTFALKK